MPKLSDSRTPRLKSSKYMRGRSSKSPTITSSRSEKSFWTRSFKNQPIPAIIGRRVIRQKYNITNDSEDQQEIIAVQEEEEQENIEKKKRRLPVFKVINDCDQFSEYRKGRILSERKRQYSSQRCKSVESLKLPQVEEYEKEDDELRKNTMAKLLAVRDNNEFGQQRIRRSSSTYTEVISRVESLQVPQFTSGLYAEQIQENQAEQTKSVKLSNQKSIITSELQKLIVDELDEKRKKKQQVYKEDIQSIIEEEKHEEEIDTQKLRYSLEKFQEQSEYLKKLDDGDQDSDSKNNMRFSNTKSESGAEIVHEEDEDKDSSENEKIEQIDENEGDS